MIARNTQATPGRPKANCFSIFSNTAPTITAGMVATTTRQNSRRSSAGRAPRLNTTAMPKSNQSRQK